MQWAITQSLMRSERDSCILWWRVRGILAFFDEKLEGLLHSLMKSEWYHHEKIVYLYIQFSITHARNAPRLISLNFIQVDVNNFRIFWCLFQIFKFISFCFWDIRYAKISKLEKCQKYCLLQLNSWSLDTNIY